MPDIFSYSRSQPRTVLQPNHECTTCLKSQGTIAIDGVISIYSSAVVY